MIDRYFLHEEIYKMNFTKTIFALAIGSVGIMGAMSATAATLTNGSTLSIVTGAVGSSGTALAGTTSWFAMDNNGDSKIQLSEKVALAPGSDGGIVIGANQGLGGMVAQWSFFSGPGYNYTPVTAITGGTGGLDFSGMTVNWNGGDINMGAGGAWNPLNAAAAGMSTTTFTNSVANLTWDGVSGHGYTLDYTATVPSGSFQGVQYSMHLTGVATVAAVPEASTYGMMLAGLGLVGFAVRRRKLI
ncbi:MAG TPA: PEP-CTERM sorting domain-containing protein [Thiobacillus sp.]